MVAVIVKGSFTVQKYLVEIIIWLIYIIPVIISLIIMLLLNLKVFILFKKWILFSAVGRSFLFIV